MWCVRGSTAMGNATRYYSFVIFYPLLSYPKLLQHLLRPFPAYWFHSSHIHSWFKTQEDHPQVPIFKRTIFVIHNEDLGLCEPQQISFKVCSFLYSFSSPSVLSLCFLSHYMHSIIITLRWPLLFRWCILSKMIMSSPRLDEEHIVPTNFWPHNPVIEVDIRKPDLKELVRMGYPPFISISLIHRSLLILPSPPVYLLLFLQAQKKTSGTAPHALFSSSYDTIYETSIGKVQQYCWFRHHFHAVPR